LAVDAQAQKLLDMMAEAGGPPLTEMSPEEARGLPAILAELTGAGPEIATVRDVEIPGPAGAIPARVYEPVAEPPGTVVYFHGGGWVIGDLDTWDAAVRNLAKESGARVVSVDYRLAPEHRFPAAADDASAATQWAAKEFDGPIVVAGDSAGGNLAAVVALVAREEGLRAPRLQLLVYPVTDRETESPSMIENATGYFLEAERMDWFWDLYAASAADHGDWRYSPMRVADCAGLPRALVITAEFDPLRDQGEAYGERLRAAGVETEILRADGLFHGFFGMHAFMSAAQPSWDTSVSALQDACGVETK